MSRRPPLLPLADQDAKKEYIKNHLSSEIHWLLYAATEWSIQSLLNLEIGGYHVEAYAMDSACLHARVLFEFFTKKTSSNYYGCDQFLAGNNPLKSDLYSTHWANPLHAFLMHAQDRSKPCKLPSFDLPQVDKDLNKMPVDFANEVLRLWKDFESELGKLGDQKSQELQVLARKTREEAVQRAECVTRSKVAQQYAKEKGLTLAPIFTT